MKANYFQEKHLLYKAKNKDPEAFTQVYDLYVDRIYRFIFFKINNQEETYDLTSEVFLKTWQYIVDGKEIKNLNAFFYQIARNLVIDHYRKSNKKDISLEREDLENIKAEANEVEALENKIQLEKIDVKLKDLKDEYREVIILRFIEGLSIKEISDIIDKKKSNVRVLLFRALKTLKDLVDNEPKNNSFR